MIVALAGGVGGAKLAHGLYRILKPNELTVVVNTADDFTLYDLRICPDGDTVYYTLAGLANPATGWGVAGDTFETLAALRRYGEDTWFQLGDRDFATHLLRTQWLRSGWRLTSVWQAFTNALQVRARILPMSDDRVATVVRTPAGELAFQDYFVRRHHADEVLGVQFAGIEEAQITDEVRKAITSAESIVFCPSNPIVSIGPILAVPGMRELIHAARTAGVPVVAVSPIVGGRALRGPADRMLSGLGHEASSFAVAELYRDLLSGIVIDHEDQEEAARIETLGMHALVTRTIMENDADREQLAADVLNFIAKLRFAGGVVVGE